jgi:curved DNA-binding protein CbpA
MKKEYYDILNLEPSASEDEIKQAYRILAKKYHPDVNPDPDAHQLFLQISEAYEYLLDDLKNPRGRIYDQEEINPEFFEEMRRAARERAQERARQRFEKLQKEKEEYQESGLYDFVLVTSYLARYSLFLICLLLIVISVILSLGYTESSFVLRVIMMLAGWTGIFFMVKAGKRYFLAGKFFYNFRQIKKFFSYIDPDAQEQCYYSPRLRANSKPYRLEMIKIKDIKLKNYGLGQHGVAFDQKSVTLNVPRSKHALVVHSLLILVKFTILFYCVFFLGISSFIWRIIIAIFLTLVVSKIVLTITGTKSTVSYLVTTGLVIRICVWLLVIFFVSYIQLEPFNIYTSDNIYGILVFMLFFDSFFDQFLNFISRKRFRIPWFKQHPLVESRLDENYQFGYDMPVLSVFYPLYKWFLG